MNSNLYSNLAISGYSSHQNKLWPKQLSCGAVGLQTWKHKEAAPRARKIYKAAVRTKKLHEAPVRIKKNLIPLARKPQNHQESSKAADKHDKTLGSTNQA